MPRYALNLDPFARPVTPASDALTSAVAQVTAAIQERRNLEDARNERSTLRNDRLMERDYNHSRDAERDRLTLEDRDYRREQDTRRITLEDEDRQVRSDDRQRGIEREVRGDRRQDERDALDLYKLNEDMDYRDRQAIERQIQNMNILDAREEAATARTQPRRMEYKDARNLALDQAAKEAGYDVMGKPKAVNPNRVDALTEELLRGGQPRPQAAPAAPADPAVQEQVFDVLDPPAVTAAVPPAPPEQAPAAPVVEPGILDKLAAWFGGGGEPAEPVMGGSGSEQAKRQFLAGAGGAGILAPNFMEIGDNQPAQAVAAESAPITPVGPEPAPEYLAHMEQLSQANGENFKRILRELKAKNPAEYAATVRALTAREAARSTVSAK